MNLLSIIKKIPDIKEGRKTTRGLVLYKKPSLLSVPEIKFAVFSDDRFYRVNHYSKFEDFLPESFRLAGPPANQNCFSFCLNEKGKVNRYDFYEVLKEKGFNSIFDNEEREGDIIAYYHIDPDINGFNHAGIYIGSGRVRSR